jgi:hypothetical protein
MSKHNTAGKIVIGSGTSQRTVQEPGKGIKSEFLTNKPPKKTTKTKTKKDDSDTKKGKQTFKSKFLYGGSEGVDESVKKEDYDDPRKHKLRNQFDYLVDKYYGGTKEGAEEFAKTSQGQVLLGYLAGVSADRGGGRGSDIKALQAGAPELFQRTQMGLPNITVDPSFNRSITPFDIRNLSAQAVKDNLTKAGITDTNAFRRFNQALQVAAPDAFAQAKPFSSGQGLGSLIEKGAGFVPGLGMASRFIGGLLPQKATGGLSPDEYLDQSLFENLPTQTTTDQGGMNDVAQFMIDNQAPVDDEEEVVTINPEDMVLPGFGIYGDPNLRLLPLDGTGITNQMLTGFTV